MHWSKNPKIRDEVLRKLSNARKGKPSPMKGRKWSLESRKKLSKSIKKAYRNGKVFGYQKGHQFYGNKENLYKFTKDDRNRAHATVRANGAWNRGKKCSWTGENHWNWKGGYQRKLYNNRKRSNLKRDVEGSHTLEEWEALKAKYDYMCLCCKKQEPEIVLTVDHIVPITKGGSDNIDNIQPLCQGCNSRKYNNIISYLPIAA